MRGGGRRETAREEFAPYVEPIGRNLFDREDREGLAPMPASVPDNIQAIGDTCQPQARLDLG
jgi:hypothetical protein